MNIPNIFNRFKNTGYDFDNLKKKFSNLIINRCNDFGPGTKLMGSINKIKNSGKTHAHKMQAAIAMSQRAKVASERAKDPEKKKDLASAHRVYQQYINANKKSKD